MAIKGQKTSEATKEKMRISALRNIEKFGLPAGLKVQPFQKGHKLNLGMRFGQEFKDKMSIIARARIARGVPMPTNFKETGVGYSGIHRWVANHYGRERKCELCGNIRAKRYEWANKTDEFSRDRANWLRLCTKCHFKMDNKSQKIWETRCKNLALKN